MKEEVRLAQVDTDRRLQEAALETERRRVAIAQEQHRLAQAQQAAAIEAEAPVPGPRVP